MSSAPLQVSLVGFGRMGKLHAGLYAQSRCYELSAICCRPQQQETAVAEHPGVRIFVDYREMLREVNSDLVCIATHLDSHAQYAEQAMAAGRHVFLEKPAACDLATTRKLFALANETGRKLVVGYVLQHDLAWQGFTDACRDLDGSLHIECTLDQHSTGEEWLLHQRILAQSSIAFDCGIHFFDIFCQVSHSTPVSVLCHELKTHAVPGLHANSTDVSITFKNGSSARYRSAWGDGFADPPLESVSCKGARETVLLELSETSARVIKEDDKGIRRELVLQDDHLALAHVAQQNFVADAVKHNLNLRSHQERVLQSMHIAELADVSALAGELVVL